MPTRTKRPTKPAASRPDMPGYGVSTSKKGMLPFSHFEKLFGGNCNYFVATAAPGGRPHVMPVWGVWNAGRFFFSTGSRTRKARNLAENPQCAITIEDGAQPVMIEGVATRLTKASAFKGAAAAYKKKYDWPLTLWGTLRSEATESLRVHRSRRRVRYRRHPLAIRLILPA